MITRQNDKKILSNYIYVTIISE